MCLVVVTVVIAAPWDSQRKNSSARSALSSTVWERKLEMYLPLQTWQRIPEMTTQQSSKAWMTFSQKPQSGTRGQRQLCKQSGKDHPQGKCPAMGATCFKCNRKGHFGSQCLSKTVAKATPQQDLDVVMEDSDGFLGASVLRGIIVMVTSLPLNGREMPFKLDTGAEVTAISKQAFEHLKGVQLKPASRRLYGPTHQPLKVLRHFQTTLSKSQKTSTQSVYVIESLRTNLLGLPAISSLQLASRIDACEHGGDVTQRFPTLFQGLGT